MITWLPRRRIVWTSSVVTPASLATPSEFGMSTMPQTPAPRTLAASGQRHSLRRAGSGWVVVAM